jgi:hypothetical protein
MANVVKYIQRAEYKNGKEDYKKAYDYCKRMMDWINEKKLGE